MSTYDLGPVPSEQRRLHSVQLTYEVLQRLHGLARLEEETTTEFLSQALVGYATEDVPFIARPPRVRPEVTNVRVMATDEVWAAARRRASLEGTTVSAVLSKLADAS